jgi:hypothetical protein
MAEQERDAEKSGEFHASRTKPLRRPPVHRIEPPAPHGITLDYPFDCSVYEVAIDGLGAAPAAPDPAKDRSDPGKAKAGDRQDEEKTRSLVRPEPHDKQRKAALDEVDEYGRLAAYLDPRESQKKKDQAPTE